MANLPYDLGEKVKIKIDGEKHKIPAKHSYQYQSSIVIGLGDMPSTKWYRT